MSFVVEGRAERITDESRLRPVASAYRAKYPPPFQFEVRDGGFHEPSGNTHPIVFEIRPSKMLAFRKDDPFAQTRFVPGD